MEDDVSNGEALEAGTGARKFSIIRAMAGW
jgi:hypothetical protein